MRIREAQKHTDTDPAADRDPQHCREYQQICRNPYDTRLGFKTKYGKRERQKNLSIFLMWGEIKAFVSKLVNKFSQP
jgi:hypothetical protein